MRFFNRGMRYKFHNKLTESFKMNEISRKRLVGFKMDYYIDLIPFVYSVDQGIYGSFDKEGIPIVNYGGSIGEQYNPTTVSKYALGNLQFFLRNNNEVYRDRFLKMIEWLVKKAKIKKDFAAWFIEFDWPLEDLKKPWPSAMTQGLAISALIRGSIIFNNQKYVDTIKKASEFFFISIDEGGILLKDDYGTWLEETPTNPPLHILNGFIYSIFGLYDSYIAIKDERLQSLLNETLNTVLQNLERYDIGHWSLRDLYYRIPSSTKYHRLHIQQLLALSKITNNRIFASYSRKWQQYTSSIMNIFKSQTSYLYRSIRLFTTKFGFIEGLNVGLNSLYTSLIKKM